MLHREQVIMSKEFWAPFLVIFGSTCKTKLRSIQTPGWRPKNLGEFLNAKNEEIYKDATSAQFFTSIFF